MRDLLDAIAIEMPCTSCGGTYTVSLRQIQGGHQMLDDGCGVRHFEDCPPAWWSRLLPASALAQVEAAIQAIQSAANEAGGRMVCVQSSAVTLVRD